MKFDDDDFKEEEKNILEFASIQEAHEYYNKPKEDEDEDEKITKMLDTIDKIDEYKNAEFVAYEIREGAHVYLKKDIQFNKMIEGMSNTDYHNSGRVGSTMLGVLMDNALKYKMIVDKVIKFESEAFDMGTILHTKILEPIESDNVFIVEDLEISRVVKKIIRDDLEFVSIPEEFLTPSGAISKTKDKYQAYEEFKCANSDKLLVSNKDIDMIEYLNSTNHLIRISNEKDEQLDIAVENTKQLPDFQTHINNGYVEKVFHAVINGVKVQIKIDLFFNPDPSKPKEIVIIDYKSTAKEATNEEFLKSSASFNYYGQEAFYTRVAEENGFIVKAFFFAYASRLIYGGASYQEHNESDKELGRTYVSKALLKYKYCKENDIYLVNNFNGKDFDLVGRGALPNYVHYKYNT
jgi:hypothetical protein